jgi:ComF family protein
MDRGTNGHAVSERLRHLSTCAAAWARLRHYWIPAAIDAVLPARCLLCGGCSRSDALCPPCLTGLPSVFPACPSCALPLTHGRQEAALVCGACQRRPRPWATATASLRYDFPVDRLVRALKYRGDLAAGAALAQAMLLGQRPPGGFVNPPWLVPVPLHAWRERRRGFNQAMELSRPLARATGWTLVDGLQRVRRTPPQSRLGARQRRHNLRGAFRWRGPPPGGQPIVLVDDVMTTGATLEACARAVRGAASVSVWVATRALSPDDDR